MTAVRVKFAALGELTVEVDGTRHPVRQRREGLILSLLIAAHGAAVAADRLITDIWADEAPERALASLQVGVSRLRSMIEPDRAPRASASRLVSATGGYALRAQVDDVDVLSFEAAAEECLSGSEADRIARADVALDRWGGEPYALGSEVESLRVEADRLRELRVAVLAAPAGSMLRLGQHQAAARSLADLFPGTPSGKRCGRCWRWPNIGPGDKPTRWPPFGPCASAWPKIWASTRRPRSGNSSWQFWPRMPSSRPRSGSGSPRPAQPTLRTWPPVRRAIRRTPLVPRRDPDPPGSWVGRRP